MLGINHNQPQRGNTMFIETLFSKDNTVLVISIKGKFDFTLLNEFRQAYSNDAAKSTQVTIDMRNTPTIDSSALGMLLNMQRAMKKKDGEISIINCNKDVKKIFQITHFSKKFTIE